MWLLRYCRFYIIFFLLATPIPLQFSFQVNRKLFNIEIYLDEEFSSSIVYGWS
jgi:hypothetical protein